jgi:hypothetical protein
MRAQETTRFGSERGIALITTLLVMMLMSALLIGFTTVVMSDQKYRLIDRDRVRSFYAAHSGLEKLNTDLSNLFLNNVAPTAAQIAALKDNPPTIQDVEFIDSGEAAYGVTLQPPPLGCTDPCSTTISSGPYAGLIALKKIYRLDSTARTLDGGETHLMRKVETVTIPVFQFGVFSDVDLSFHAGANFNFGGRVHSNRDLFLAQGGGATLTLPERVTAVRDVIRKKLANGQDITITGHTSTVSLATAPNAFRSLLDTEGSVNDGAGSATNPAWPTISLSTYNGYIRNTATGARRLDLPLLTTGGANADMIKRPLQNEDSTNPDLLTSRYYNNVSLRILLSDTAADIMSLPTITGTAPVQLDGNWRTTPPNNGTPYVGLPIARSPGRLLVNGNLPTVAAAVAASNNTTITVSNPTAANAVLPVEWKLPTVAAPGVEYFALTVNKGGVLYNLTCRTKASATQFTGCVSTTPPAATVATPATVSAALSNNTVVSSNLNASWASPWTSITVVSTAAFTPNTFTVKVIKGAATYTVHCGVKTPTTFTNCIPEVAPGATVSAPATVRAENVPSVDGNFSIDRPLGANWASNANAWLSWATINATDTMAYSPNTFWVLNTDNTNVLVTCTGFQYTNQLTGCNVPAALTANAQVTSGALSNAGTGTIGGFIKIEMQDVNKNWSDVTMQFLNYGITAPNLTGRICDPSPNAIIRVQRVRDNAETGAGACSYQASPTSSDYWPNVIFDTREALFRDVAPANNDLALGGVMHYVAIDARNLSLWFQGAAPYAGGSGAQALKDNGGFSVYFSDRRNNRDTANRETGEYGFENIINPLDAAGTPNVSLDTGEDANGNGTLETYGQFPSYNGASSTAPPGALAPLTNAARPTTLVRAPFAMVNRALLFRRALKLTNGALGNIVMPGLTIASEGSVYIQGSWNANQADALGETNAATSLVADSVSLLSDNWNDLNSITSPYNLANRNRSANSYYRIAIIAGKNQAFPWPAAGNPPSDFGTDGGVHNFLRMLEQGGTVHYRGSIATFFYSRQALGVYKCCNTVYGAPTRRFFFDTDFLNPALLPPLTPMFRDTNSLGFAQEVRPGK